MERPAHLGSLVRRCERVFDHSAVESSERAFVGSAELQREAHCEERARHTSQRIADVRGGRGIQAPVCGAGSGGRVRAVGGEHVQVGFVRSSCGAAGAGWRSV